MILQLKNKTTEGILVKLKELITSFNLYARPYRVYSANLTQTSTNAPIAHIFENSLGYDITFIYDGPGLYYMNTTGKFTSGKTWVHIGQSQYGATIIDIVSEQQNMIVTKTADYLTELDGVLNNTLIEVRVYK